MRWGHPPIARSRLQQVFVWLPTQTKNRTWVWLEKCWRYEHSGEAAGIFDYYNTDDTDSLNELTRSLGYGSTPVVDGEEGVRK